jgi:hypothetical protein
MKKDNKQRLFEVMEVVNPDFKTSSDHFREINQMKNARKEATRYTSQEKVEISAIENELAKVGFKRDEYQLESSQDAYGTKTPRFEFRFYTDDIDTLLNKTNLDVYKPIVGSQVHGYILRKLRIK